MDVYKNINKSYFISEIFLASIISKQEKHKSLNRHDL